MTLLVLELHGPAKESIHSEGDLWKALSAMMPQIVTWLMSFLTLGIFWSGQQVQLNEFERGDRHLAWIHLAFLSAVSVMPFSTRLLADYIGFKTALLCYWVNIALPCAILFASWRYARRAGLVRKEVTRDNCRAVARRIVVAQGLYAVGAALCVGKQLRQYRLHRSGPAEFRTRAAHPVSLENPDDYWSVFRNATTATASSCFSVYVGIGGPAAPPRGVFPVSRNVTMGVVAPSFPDGAVRRNIRGGRMPAGNGHGRHYGDRRAFHPARLDVAAIIHLGSVTVLAFGDFLNKIFASRHLIVLSKSENRREGQSGRDERP